MNVIEYQIEQAQTIVIQICIGEIWIIIYMILTQ